MIKLFETSQFKFLKLLKTVSKVSLKFHCRALDNTNPEILPRSRLKSLTETATPLMTNRIGVKGKYEGEEGQDDYYLTSNVCFVRQMAKYMSLICVNQYLYNNYCVKKYRKNK